MYFEEDVGGPLLNRYNNQLRRQRLKADYCYKNKTKKHNEQNNNKSVDSLDPTNSHSVTADELLVIAKVNTYYTPWSVFKHDWMSVFHIRDLDILTMDWKDLVDKWPQFKNVQIALHLVSYFSRIP